jgi:hypothetical protein
MAGRERQEDHYDGESESLSPRFQGLVSKVQQRADQIAADSPPRSAAPEVGPRGQA